MKFKRIYLATCNQNKLDEIKRLFEIEKINVEVCSPKKLGGMPSVLETESTYAGNAKLKARSLQEKLQIGEWVLSDDSGLEVESLNGQPGVYSARFAGENVTYRDNNEKLIRMMQGHKNRKARFICCCVLLGCEEKVFEGICEGEITEMICGQEGFGYDPVFIPRGYDKTFSELGKGVKDKMSHRALAVQAVVDWVKKISD